MFLQWVVGSDLALNPSVNPTRLVLFRVPQQNSRSISSSQHGASKYAPHLPAPASNPRTHIILGGSHPGVPCYLNTHVTSLTNPVSPFAKSDGHFSRSYPVIQTVSKRALQLWKLV
jgi:hypothetical protein